MFKCFCLFLQILHPIKLSSNSSRESSSQRKPSHNSCQVSIKCISHDRTKCTCIKKEISKVIWFKKIKINKKLIGYLYYIHISYMHLTQ